MVRTLLRALFTGQPWFCNVVHTFACRPKVSGKDSNAFFVGVSDHVLELKLQPTMCLRVESLSLKAGRAC